MPTAPSRVWDRRHASITGSASGTSTTRALGGAVPASAATARLPQRPRAAWPGRRPSSRRPDVTDVDLDRGDLETGQPSDLVRDPRPKRRRHLGEVEAVLDDDVEGDGQAVVGMDDVDSPLGRVAEQQPTHTASPPRHRDHAVALAGDEADDLGD